jgi:hypothetical protein
MFFLCAGRQTASSGGCWQCGGRTAQRRISAVALGYLAGSTSSRWPRSRHQTASGPGPRRRCRGSWAGRYGRSPPLPSLTRRATSPTPRLLRRFAQTVARNPLAVSVIGGNPGRSWRRSRRACLRLSCRRRAPRHSGNHRETDKTCEHHGDKTHVNVHSILVTFVVRARRSAPCRDSAAATVPVAVRADRAWRG